VRADLLRLVVPKGKLNYRPVKQVTRRMFGPTLAFPKVKVKVSVMSELFLEIVG